jgi:hypothetical protein
VVGRKTTPLHAFGTFPVQHFMTEPTLLLHD